ncbi:CsbD family protein [Reyranella sp.]|uniref:CsbD family protein n=1 Tax=Reyranella sp. TaxID=1929291 RepID=UPI003BA973B0
MRSIATVAACTALAVVSLPLVAMSQTTAQTTTTQNDAQTMWEKVKGSWSQTKGAVKEQWGELTDDDLLAIEGRRDQLVGKIQTRYGISREAAEAQVGAWEKGRLKDM